LMFIHIDLYILGIQFLAFFEDGLLISSFPNSESIICSTQSQL
jgi:hypothetical protein